MGSEKELGPEVRRLRERLRELEAYCDASRLEPTSIRFAEQPGADEQAVHVGDRWPTWVRPAWFTTTFDIPKDWPGEIELWADFGGEGCLIEDGKAQFGFNPMHRHCVLPRPSGKGPHTYSFEVVPHGYQGAPVHDPRVNICRLVVPNEVVRRLHRDLDTALKVLAWLADEGDLELGVRLRDAIEAALRAIALPREPSKAYLARMAWLDATEVEGGSADSPALQVRSTLWERPVFGAAPLELDQACEERIEAATKLFAEKCRQLAERYPGRGKFSMLGHAHIDVAWLWPISETRNKARRTFATAAALAERYPDYIFGQSQAALYEYVERDDPALLERIKALVARGQWEVLGGSWVEPDGNLASGESTVRQLFYGQRYFEQKFGKRSTVAWLPDTFGYAGNLPQLYVSAGMPYFMTTKLGWNETNEFPHDLYWWEGLDGTRVLSHTFKHLDVGAEPAMLAESWSNFRGKVRAERALQTFGRGDGGGGPNEEMIEGLRRLADFAGVAKTAFGTAEEVFEELAGAQGIPVWKGEKYLEKHRGTFTSQVAIKRDVQILGETLREAEAASCIAWIYADVPYPTVELERGWKTLLVHEFHDILPGSSIHTVNEEGKVELAKAIESITSLRDAALASVHEAAPGEVSHWQLRSNVRLKPASGQSAPEPAPVRASATCLDNGIVCAEFSEDGQIERLTDAASSRVFVRGGHRLVLHEDVPREYEAWDIDPQDLAHGVPLSLTGAAKVAVDKASTGAVSFTFEGPGVTAEMTYRLAAGERALGVELNIDWRGRRQLLRLELPTTISGGRAVYDTLFGQVERPVHRNTTWDAAKYEVPAHSMVCLEDETVGLALFAPHGRHGFSVYDGQIGMSLLRGPIHPDPMADHGKHRFVYSMAPYEVPSRPAGRPPEAIEVAGVPNGIPVRPLGKSGPGCTIEAAKKAEDHDAVLIRLLGTSQASGTDAMHRFELPDWVKRVSLANILEDELEEVPIQSQGEARFVELNLVAFELATLLLFR